MLKPAYITLLKTDRIPSMPEIYVLNHPNKRGSWYYISTYNYFKSRKDAFFKILERQGQKEMPASWELHHVVEKRHMKPFYPLTQVDFLYENEWPCVLIHKQEHDSYTSLLSVKETKSIFDLSKPSGVLKLYDELYGNNHVLQKIANNIIKTIPAKS